MVGSLCFLSIKQYSLANANNKQYHWVIIQQHPLANADKKQYPTANNTS